MDISGADIAVGDVLMTHRTSHNGTVRYDIPVRVVEADDPVDGRRRIQVEYVHTGEREPGYFVALDSEWTPA